MAMWRGRGEDQAYKKGERAAAHLSCGFIYSDAGLAVAALAAATLLSAALVAAVTLTTSGLLTTLLLTATFVSLVWHFFPPR
jgi:hypothetical protein